MTRNEPASIGEAPLGAYGLRLSGIAAAEAILAPADRSWPRLRISAEIGSGELEREHLDDREALLRLRTGGRIHVDRSSGGVLFTVPSALSADELVHPFLAPVAAVTAFWYGRESLHGGGLSLGGKAWGVIGDRLGGKSSLLAALALGGVEVISDDVLVVDGLDVFVGPRTVDLRADAAEALRAGESIGTAGARERWRLRLGPLEGPLPLGGWIFTAWADDLTVRRLAPSEALVRLLRNRAINVAPEDPARFLHLSALPALELRRPRSWETMSAALELLLGALEEA
jgi:hypothetical protein